MSLSSLSSVAARFELVPTLRAGPLWFGASVESHGDLLQQVPFDDDDEHEHDYVEYAVPGLEHALAVYADADGRIESVSFYAFCQLRGRDLIGMDVGQLLVVLGQAPDAIEPETIGGELEVVYTFEQLGLLIWTQDGTVAVVQADPGS